MKSSKEKGAGFRKHNFVVGFNKPSYETMTGMNFKPPERSISQSVNHDAVDRRRKELRKANFSFGNEDSSFVNSRHSPFNRSYDMAQQLRDEKEEKTQSRKNPRNGNKSIFTLMKQQNIVYGYEKINPYLTSNNFYLSTKKHSYSHQANLEEMQNLKRSNFELGNEAGQFSTSNKMQPIKIMTESKRDHNGNKEPANRTNKSHVQFSQPGDTKLYDISVYKESTYLPLYEKSVDLESRSAKRDVPLISRPQDINNSNIVLGFQKLEMVTEAKDKFNKQSP